MSSYKEGQTHQLADALEANGFTSDQLTNLGQNSNGVLSGLKMVLLNLATIVLKPIRLACTKSLDPSQFFNNKNWTTWRGSAGGDGLKGEEDRDNREDALTEIDWAQMILETNLQGDETVVDGEEKLKRLKAGGNLRLGGRAFLSLWEDYQTNRANSVLEKLRLGKGVKCIYFFGQVLRNPLGSRCVLCLCFDGGQWDWRCRWLGSDWAASSPSASLASVN